MFKIESCVYSAVARPNGQPRQAGMARGVRGHAKFQKRFDSRTISRELP